MAEIKLSDDKPFNELGLTFSLNTAATPASAVVPESGIYDVNILGIDGTHLVLLRVANTELLAETIAAVSGVAQEGVSAKSVYNTRPIYAEKGQYIGVYENGATAGLQVVFTLIHRFRAEGLVG